MKKRLLSVAFLMGAMGANAQVGIGTATPNKSAELLIQSSDRGLLIPNVALKSTTDKTTITNGNVTSLLVFATIAQGDIKPGYHYWDGAKWARLTADQEVPQLVADQFSKILKIDGDKVTNLIKGLFSETTTNVDRQKAGKYIYTNEKGTVQPIDVVGDLTEILKGGVYPAFDTVLEKFIDKAETVTSLLYDGTARTLSYKDENRETNTIDIAQILKDYTTNTLAVSGNELVSTVNGVEGKTDLTGAITTPMLKDGAVTNDKLSAGKGDDNRVAVADKDGKVTYKTQKEIVEGNTSNELKLDGNKLTSTVNGKTSTVSLTENSVVSSKGITGTGIFVDGGANATLKDVKLSIEDGAITPTKMAKGEVGTILVTDKDGKVKWVKEDAAIIKDMVKANESITTLKDNGNGTFTYFNEADYGTDGQLKPGATGTPFDANTLNITTAGGVYTFTDKSGKELAKIDTNAKASGYDNGTSGLTSTDVQGAIDELVKNITNVANTKGTLSSTDIVISQGVDVVLKDVTLAIATGAITTDKLGAGAVTTEKIAAGTNGQVLVTVTETGKEVTKWVDKKDATSNELTSAGNTMTSNVNGVSKTADIVNSIGNTLDKDNKLVTTVNGIAGEGVDLTPAIQAGQKTTSVEKGSDKVTVVGTTTGKNTEYKVDVVEGELNLGNMGGQVTTTQITDGAVTTEKIAAGTAGQVLVTVTENGKEVTKWMPANDLGNTVTAGNGLTKTTAGEIKLGGELTEKTTLTTTQGKELAIKGLEDVTTNPSTNNIVLTDPITGELKQTSAKNLLEDTITKGGTADELKAKTLKGEGITVTAGNKVGTSLEVVNALLKDVILGIANGAITEDKIDAGAVTEGKLGAGAVTTDKLGAGAVTTEKIAAGTNGQLLVTVTENGKEVTKWVDKKDATSNDLKIDGGKLVSTVNGQPADLDLTNQLTEGMLNGGKGTDGRVAVTDKDGKVTYKEVSGEALNGKALTSGSIKVFGGSQALLDGTVIEVQGGTKDGQVLVTKTKEIVVGKDANGADIKETHQVTEWVDQSTIVPTTTNEFTLGTDNKLVSNVNGVAKDVDLTSKVTEGMLNGGKGTDGRVAVTDKDGKVTYKEIKVGDIKDAKNITSKTIAVGGVSGSTLQDVTLEIVAGTEGQVMVSGTDVDGKPTTKWVDKKDATTNKLTKKTTGEGADVKTDSNTIVSNVNGVTSEVKVIDSIENSLDKDNKLVTTVNGKVGTGVDLTPAIQAGQKTTSVKEGSDKVTVVGTTTGKNTEYVVDVVEANIKLENVGGQLPADKLKPGKDGQTLVTVTEKDADGKEVIGADGKPVSETKWVDKKEATSNDLKIDGGKLVSTVNGQPAELDLTNQLTEGMLNGGKGADGRVAVTDKDGKVTYQEVSGKALNGKALTSGSIKVFGGSQALLDGTVIEVQGGAKDGQVLVTKTKEIVVGKDANGTDIKETHQVTEWVDQLPTNTITPGTEGQVLVTEGGITKWVDKTPTTNTLTKKTTGEGADAKTDSNTIVSTVNGVPSEVKVIDAVENKLSGTNITTTVNGVPSTSVDLTPAIQAGQKTTTVEKGSDKVTVVETTNGNNTEYKVDVVEGNIKLENLGGQLPADKLKPGTDGQVLVTEGGVTKWVEPKETVLAGDVTSKAGKTVVNGIQGTPVSETKPSTDGQALVFENGKWVPGTPAINADQVKNGKDLTTDGIIVVEGANPTEAKGSLLAAAKLSIKAGSITADKLSPVGGNAGDVLTTTGTGADTKVEWKTPAEDKDTNIYTNDGKIVGTDTTKVRLVDLDGNKLTFKNTDSFTSISGNTLEHVAENTKRVDVAIRADKSSLNIFQDPGNDSQVVAEGESTGLVLGANGKNPLNGANNGIKLSVNTVTRATLNGEGTLTVGQLGQGDGAEKATDKYAALNVENGHVKITKINELSGTQYDKVVVANAEGVLKTVTGVMPKVFYMPPVMFDTSDKNKYGVEQTRNLYEEYVAMFGGTGAVTDMTGRPPMAKSDATATIPVYNAGELNFFIPYYDPTVFSDVNVDATGKLTYKVNKKAKYGAFMTVVFVVK